MILPTPGADPASRLFGYATPPDGAGPLGPDQLWPTPVTPSPEELRHATNPLQYVPVIGTIYRMVTGEQIPTTLKVMGAAATGGPISGLLAGFMGLIEGLISMGPDLSRPSLPAGMSNSAEVAMAPVTPGTLDAGAYTTLATTTPEWMQSPTQFAEPNRGAAAYQQASLEWQRTQMLEKGIA